LNSFRKQYNVATITRLFSRFFSLFSFFSRLPRLWFFFIFIFFYSFPMAFWLYTRVKNFRSFLYKFRLISWTFRIFFIIKILFPFWLIFINFFIYFCQPYFHRILSHEFVNWVFRTLNKSSFYFHSKILENILWCHRTIDTIRDEVGL